MFRSITTKTGDHGESGLANGKRIPKDDFLFEVLGTQDEVNAWLGLSLAKLSTRFDDEKKFVMKIQEALFYIGAELAGSPAKLNKKMLTELETHSETLQRKMEDNWTTKFLFPGGSEEAATLDVARTVSRRFERVVVKYARTVKISPLMLQYVNRLSDYLYVLRSFVNYAEQYPEKQFIA